MGAEIPSLSELIVRVWAVFLHGEWRARDFGDAVARACKTPVRLRRQCRELVVRTSRNCPHRGSISITMAIGEGGVLVTPPAIKGTAGSPDFFCICGTKRSFFSVAGIMECSPFY